MMVVLGSVVLNWMMSETVVEMLYPCFTKLQRLVPTVTQSVLALVNIRGYLAPAADFFEFYR